MISAWRTRFISRVRSEITSFALSAAFRIAVIRAPCSEAVDSSSARKTLSCAYSGISSPSSSSGSGS